ncbi:MAG: flavin reductase [Blastopirellula sp.]|nr:MAG: flavin reductase [Blastopirellula sp.]
MFFEPKKGHDLPHNPIAACVSPRPIGWISTLSKSGIGNLAPFSYFNLVHNHPPTVMFACNGLKADGTAKDSWTNAEETGEFVYNVAAWKLREHINLTSTSFDAEVDELAEYGLTPRPSKIVKPVGVAESPIQFECKTTQIIHLESNSKENPSTIVFGQVVGVHIDDECLVDGRVDYDKVMHISRLGYLDYAVIGERFFMPSTYVKREQK